VLHLDSVTFRQCYIWTVLHLDSVTFRQCYV